MGEVIEIRSHTDGKRYRYRIRNIQSIDISLSTPVVATPMPEMNDSNNILTKADGNTTRITIAWVIHDESTDIVTGNPYSLSGGAGMEGTDVTAFPQFSSDTGFRLADHQVRFLLEPNNALSGASGFQTDRLTDTYQIILGNTGYSRQGLIEQLQITKSSSSPATWNASLVFVVGNSITGTGKTLAPTRPTSLAAIAGDDKVTLTWKAPNSVGASSITDYKVEWSLEGTSWAHIDGIGSVLTYVKTGLEHATLYFFRVSAINSNGTSDPSSIVTATTT